MTDWRAAGRKADAHRVRDLYRAPFDSHGKQIARRRVIQALKVAGVTTVLDLWGGGLSAIELRNAGFRVIAVEDGSMELVDNGRPVSRARKRRALEYAAAEDGYEARFGKAEHFAAEADGAYLDFCGPWSAAARRAVSACRHMKAVAVTLTPDHDLTTDATSPFERQMAYQLFLKMAWSSKPRWEAMASSGHVRRFLDYRRARGYYVFLYLLSRSFLNVPSLKASDREKTNPEMHARHLAVKRKHYHGLSPERKLAWGVRTRENAKRRYHNDPVYRSRIQIKANHRKHRPGVVIKKPCVLCEVAANGGQSVTQL